MYIDFKKIGERISKRRKELGYKQCELAEKAELSNNYLSSIERGWTIPSLKTFSIICMCLETSPDYFLLGTMKTNDVPYHIIESLKLCRDDDLEVIEALLQFLISRNTENK